MGKPQPETLDALEVSTQPAADGTYIATLELGDDLSVPLTPDVAIRHAMAFITAAQWAEHIAAVVRQLIGALEMPLAQAVQSVADMRQDWPPLDADATAPLELRPGVNALKHPFIGLWLGGRQIGQLDPAGARQHASYVLAVNVAADLDGAYHRWLRASVGVGDAYARAFVGDLAAWRAAETKGGDCDG